MLGLAAEIADGFIDGHIRPKARETRAHQAASVVFRIGKQRHDFASGEIVQQLEQSGAFFFRCFLNEVGGIVGRKQTHPDAALTVRQ